MVLEKTFQLPRPVFAFYAYLPPFFYEDQAIYLNNFKFPTPKDVLYQKNYLPFEEDLALFFEQFRSPFTYGCFVPSLIKIGLIFIQFSIHFYLPRTLLFI
jgi:hypothetical protein